MSDLQEQMALFTQTIECKAPTFTDIISDTSAQLEMNPECEELPEVKPAKKTKATKKVAKEIEKEVVEVKGTPSREQVQEALQNVNASLGLPAARDILKEFDAQRISELTSDKYENFVNKCNEAIASQTIAHV